MKRINVRLQGNNRKHVLRMADACGITIRKWFDRPDGTVFGYGLSKEAYDDKEEKKDV